MNVGALLCCGGASRRLAGGSLTPRCSPRFPARSGTEYALSSLSVAISYPLANEQDQGRDDSQTYEDRCCPKLDHGQGDHDSQRQYPTERSSGPCSIGSVRRAPGAFLVIRHRSLLTVLPITRLLRDDASRTSASGLVCCIQASAAIYVVRLEGSTSSSRSNLGGGWVLGWCAFHLC